MTSRYPRLHAVPADVNEAEKLAHCILSGSDVRANGEIKPNAFALPRSTDNPTTRARDISVDRFDYLDMETAVTLGQGRAQLRGPNRQLHGWAIILARNAAGEGRVVVSSPLEGNPAHADIILPEQATTDEEERKFHQSALAEKSRWLKHPAPENWAEYWENG